MSNRTDIDDSNGVFEFEGNLAGDDFATCIEIVYDSDDDSYYSDCGFDNEYGGCGVYSSSSLDDDDDSHDVDDSHDLEDNWSDITFEPGQYDGDDYDGHVMDYVDTDADDDDDDDNATPAGFHYFTPKQVLPT